MSPAKTIGERVSKLRAGRDALGLKRLELYAHPGDWPAIKALADELQARRQQTDKQAALNDAVEQILTAGHMDQEDLARLRAAYSAA